MFYPACPSSCLTLDGEIRRKNREESPPFPGAYLRPTHRSGRFPRFRRISRAIPSLVYDYGGDTRADRLAARTFRPLTGV